MKVVSARFIRERIIDRKKLGSRGIDDKARVRFENTTFEGAEIHLLDDATIRKEIKNYDRREIREKSETDFDKIDYNLLIGQDDEEGKISYYKAVYERTQYRNFEDAKKDLEQHLNTVIKMAEDKQAVYEFIQNAEDSKANKMLFYIYNKESKWFVFANNGNKFNPNDIYSILMLSESTKYEDKESIGKYGIGFKLIHRLVMENEEDWGGLIEKLYGPVIFSWGNKEEIEDFLKLNWMKEGVKPENNWNYPILFKFLITTFPAGFKEELKLHPEFPEKNAYFTEKDVEILRNLPEWFKEEIRSWDNGSLFIVPFRTSNYKDVKNRLESLEGLLYFLKNLKEIIWSENDKREYKYTKNKNKNKNSIQLIQLSDSIDLLIISPNEESNSKESKSNSKFNSKKFIKFIDVPNVYNPIPIDDERYGFNFLINSRIFDVQAHRTKLSNRKEIKDVIQKIYKYLKELKEQNKDSYYNVYYSIITSEPKLNTDEGEEVWEYFKDELWDFLKENVPVKDKDGNIQIVSYKQIFKKKDLTIQNLFLEDFFKDNYWFPKEFEGGLLDNTNWLRFAEKKENLIGEKSIADIIRKDINEFNKWLKNNINQYEKVIKHISESKLGKEYLKNVKLILYNSDFYTIEEAKREKIIITYDCNENESIKELSKFLKNLKIAECVGGLNRILAKLNEDLNFKYTDNIIDIINNYEEINELKPKTKVDIFNIVKDRFLGDEGRKSYKIKPEDLKLLKLFKNSLGEIKPLSELLLYDLLPSNMNIEEYRWLKEFVINKEEWDTIKSSPEVRQRVSEAMTNDLKKIYTYREDYLDKENVFYNDQLTEKEIEVIGKLIGTIIHKDVLKFMKNYESNIISLNSQLLSEYLNPLTFENKNIKLTLKEVKIFLEFIKRTEDKNFFSKWTFEPIIDGDDVKYELVGKRESITVFYEGFSNETIEKLKDYDIFIIKYSMSEGYGDNFNEIFRKIGKINIIYDNGKINLNNFQKEILKEYVDRKLSTLNITINGREASEWKPYEVSDELKYPPEIDWSRVFKDKTKEAGEISKSLSIGLFGNEDKKRDIMELIFSKENLKELDKVYEIIVENKEFQETSDALLALLWLYKKFKEINEENKKEIKEIKKLIVDKDEVYTLSNTRISKCTDYIIKNTKWKDSGNWEKIIEYVRDFKSYFYDFIVVKPVLEGKKIFHPPIKDSDDCKKEFITSVFNEWKDEAYLFKGFHKKNCAVCSENFERYVYPDELALSYERVPEWLRVINSPDERYFKSFIRKLGVLTPESSNPIKLREVVYNYGSSKGGQEDV